MRAAERIGNKKLYKEAAEKKIILDFSAYLSYNNPCLKEMDDWRSW